MTPAPMGRRTVRVPHPLWQAAHDKARSRGEKLSDAIRGFLETYVRGER